VVKVACIGGGTGLPVLLRGLRQLSENSPLVGGPKLDISAIVCVSDNGGSSGHLRQSFRIPAVGDLRNCLVALSPSDRLLSGLFQYRFSEGNGLEGHSLGNLIMTAFCRMSGSLGMALELASQVLCSEGFVLPATEAEVTLCADLESGDRIRGEWQITAARSRIERVWLEPSEPASYPGVLQALDSADAIILGPGSLYTSIIPNLLVARVAEAVKNSSAVKIYICNLVTQPGETGGFRAEDHLRVLETYLGSGVVDVCVVNSHPIGQTLQDIYLESRSEAVRWSEDAITRMGVIPAVADLLEDNQLKMRHDSNKLACLIASIVNVAQHARDTLTAKEAVLLGKGSPCRGVSASKTLPPFLLDGMKPLEYPSYGCITTE